MYHQNLHCTIEGRQNSRNQRKTAFRHMNCASVGLCCAIGWTACFARVWLPTFMLSDRKRCGLCGKQIRGKDTDRAFTNKDEGVLQGLGLVACLSATHCHSNCLRAAHRQVLTQAATRPQSRSNPASLRHPQFCKRVDIQKLTGWASESCEWLLCLSGVCNLTAVQEDADMMYVAANSKNNSSAVVKAMTEALEQARFDLLHSPTGTGRH